MANTKTKTSAAKKPVVKKSVATKSVARPTATVSASKSAPKMVGFGAAVRNFFARYFEFNGVSTRAEYWWVMLFLLGVFGLGMGVIPFILAKLYMSWLALIVVWACALFAVAIIVPSVALMSRRVHDAGFSAWVFFIPWIIVNVLAWVLGLAGFGSTVLGWLGYAVSIWGLVLTLMPSKLDSNPYRN